MKTIALCILCAVLILSCGIYSVYSEDTACKPTQTKTVDVNKDGKPDVTYYHDGTNITKAEADTNYDGKPDVTVYAEDGKFKSAEADTDYDGKTDKTFSDTAEFNKWLNENRPDYKDHLGWEEWKVGLIKF